MIRWARAHDQPVAPERLRSLQGNRGGCTSEGHSEPRTLGPLTDLGQSIEPLFMIWPFRRSCQVKIEALLVDVPHERPVVREPSAIPVAQVIQHHAPRRS